MSATSSRGRRRGRPLRRGTRTVSSVEMASFTSCGRALARVRPMGRPFPSATTISLLPFPRFVRPTAAPPFLRGRSCHRGMPCSTPDGLAHPSPAGELAKSAPISLQPPSHAASSSRWLENHSGAAPLPKGSQCAAHRGSHSRQPDHRCVACPAPAASAAATARSAPTAHQSVPSLLKESIPPPPRFLKGVRICKGCLCLIEQGRLALLDWLLSCLLY
jgi:hypothetical protein